MAGVSVWSALATASDSFDSVAKEGERRVKLGGRPTWHGSKANSDIEEMKTAMREQAEVQIAAAEAAYLEVGVKCGVSGQQYRGLEWWQCERM